MVEAKSKMPGTLCRPARAIMKTSKAGTKDRYHPDATFCDRAHEEWEGLVDCIRCDMLAFVNLLDLPRSRPQVSFGVAAHAEH